MRVTRSVSVSSISPMPRSSRPKSPPRSVSNSWLRSPEATVSAISSASATGSAMLRVSSHASTAPSASAATASATM
ncbi:hypothetical protein D3C87_543480 [compost metagenome]